MNASELIRVAKSQLGVVETGGPHGNDGNIVSYWDWFDARYDAHDQGSSWCAAFVLWCLDQVGYPLPREAESWIYCPAWEAWARSHGCWVEPGSVWPGDLLLFHFPGEANEANHMGIATAVGAMTTSVEGNTSSGSTGSQSNGGGVYERTRTRSVLRGGIRLTSSSIDPKEAAVRFPFVIPAPGKPDANGRDPLWAVDYDGNTFAFNGAPLVDSMGKHPGVLSGKVIGAWTINRDGSPDANGHHIVVATDACDLANSTPTYRL